MKHQPTASGGTNAGAAKKPPAQSGTRRKASAPRVQGDGDGRDEMIRQTAYSFYVARGCVAGHELEDWLQAEAAVNATLTGTAQAADTPAGASPGA